ncbi:MAG: acyl--CoA ligase, partial [Clostridia bacterium]|nr:acyl--CoA ligase [Clostridia bacterium]
MSNLTTKVEHRPSVEKPWLKYFPPESLKVKMPRETIYQYIKKIFEKSPKGKALHYYGTSWNHSQLLEKIERAADAFAALGVKAGDIVTFLSVTTPETIYMMYALNKIGAISNLVDPRMDTSRITDAIVDVKSKVLITIDLAWPKVEHIRDKINVSDIIVISANDSLPAVAKIARKLTTKSPKIPYGDHVINTSTLMSMAKKAKA